jgi:hypothetical protein
MTMQERTIESLCGQEGGYNGIRKSNNFKTLLWGNLDRVVFVKNKFYIDAKLIIITSMTMFICVYSKGYLTHSQLLKGLKCEPK